MIRSLKINNGSFANVGDVQVQSSFDTASQATQQKIVGQTAPGVAPAAQTVVSIPVLVQNNDTTKIVRQSSLSDVLGLLGTNTRIVVPLQTRFNTVTPTYSLSLDSGRMYDPRTTAGFIDGNVKFQPYEEMTGISHERPEIVMLTNFLPLFDRSHGNATSSESSDDRGDDRLLSNAGRYFDAQVQIRNLRTSNVQQHIRSLYDRYQGMKYAIDERHNEFAAGLADLKDMSSFLLNLVRMIETQKNQLDLRHNVYDVNPIDVAKFIVQELSKHDANKVELEFKRIIEQSHPSTYTCVDCLTDAGFKASSVIENFSSTKVWMQMLVELTETLKTHTFMFFDNHRKPKDDNATTLIIDRASRRFSLSADVPNLPKLDDLIDIQTAGVTQALSIFRSVFMNVYQNSSFKDDEAKIAATSHILTQEFRYSRGLSDDNVQRNLQELYGFNTLPAGNSSIFDHIIGRFGRNIIDFRAPPRSLVSIAQNTTLGSESNVGILTFETKYVEGDSGTLTPGGDFFFDRIFQASSAEFNTSGIESLANEIDQTLKRFVTMIDHFDLLALPTTSVDPAGAPPSDVMNNSNDMIMSLSKQLINATNGVVLPSVTNDKLGAVYSQARNDTYIKSILFLYTMSKISRVRGTAPPLFRAALNIDNTSLVDHLINELMISLEKSVPQTRSAVQFATGIGSTNNTDALTIDSIKSAMKHGTVLSNIIEQFMVDVISQFRVKTSAINDGFTRFGGYRDTVIAMVAFDLAVTMVAKYSNQSLIGSHHGTSEVSQNQLTFVVSHTDVNHRASYNELLSRNTNEMVRRQKMILTVVNVLRKFNGSLRGVNNYLKSAPAKEGLQKLSTILGENISMMNLMLNEQQVMLASATIQSMVDAHDRTRSMTSSRNVAGEKDDTVVILDESNVTSELKDALWQLFNTDAYASSSAFNKRIMTVGIPLGFAQKMKQKINVNDQKRVSFTNKRNDFVYVNVYKVDVQNADIIYKPQRFLFELSRFPVRYSMHSWLSMNGNVIDSIPTQNFTQNVDFSTSNSNGASIEYSGVGQEAGLAIAFNNEDYSFLSKSQRSEVLQNHVVSQLLESYIRLMTGLNVAEYNYDLIDPLPTVERSFVKTLTDHTINHVSDLVREPTPPIVLTGGMLFATTSGTSLPIRRVTGLSRPTNNNAKMISSNISGLAGQVSDVAQFGSLPTKSTQVVSLEQQRPSANVATDLATLSHRNIELMFEHLRTISSFSNTVSSISSIDSLKRRVLTPKQFDRVFTIVVDPDEFEIDVNQTTESEYGKQALDQMIQNGDVVSVVPGSTSKVQREFPQGRANPDVNNFKLRYRDKNHGDLIADKYFVTIETLGE